MQLWRATFLSPFFQVMVVVVGILGGGPIGIEAALCAVRRGYKAIVIERGPAIASNIVAVRRYHFPPRRPL